MEQKAVKHKQLTYDTHAFVPDEHAEIRLNIDAQTYNTNEEIWINIQIEINKRIA